MTLDEAREILQVHVNAEPEVIEAAYKRLAAKYHPDRNSAPDAHERLVRLNRAYEVLRHLDRHASRIDPQEASSSGRREPPTPNPEGSQASSRSRVSNGTIVLIILGSLVAIAVGWWAIPLAGVVWLIHRNWRPIAETVERATPTMLRILAICIALGLVYAWRSGKKDEKPPAARNRAPAVSQSEKATTAPAPVRPAWVPPPVEHLAEMTSRLGGFSIRLPGPPAPQGPDSTNRYTVELAQGRIALVIIFRDDLALKRLNPERALAGVRESVLRETGGQLIPESTKSGKDANGPYHLFEASSPGATSRTCLWLVGERLYVLTAVSEDAGNLAAPIVVEFFASFSVQPKSAPSSPGPDALLARLIERQKAQTVVVRRDLDELAVPSSVLTQYQVNGWR